MTTDESMFAETEDSIFSRIDELFNEGQTQSETDESQRGRTPEPERKSRLPNNPYPDGSKEAHWWSRGYAHKARLFWGYEVESKLEGVESKLRIYETDEQLINGFNHALRTVGARVRWIIPIAIGDCDFDPLDGFLERVKLEGKNSLEEILPGFICEHFNDFLEGKYDNSTDGFINAQLWDFIVNELKLTGLIAEIILPKRSKGIFVPSSFIIRQVYGSTYAELIANIQQTTVRMIESMVVESMRSPFTDNL